MRKTLSFKPLLSLLLGMLLSGVVFGEDQPVVDLKGCPPRLSRAQSFVGMHFDFHAGDGDKNIGENVTEQMINDLIDKVKPDFIQIDCKGGGGRSSYPTKVGNRAGGFVRDSLKIWRETTAKRGVALYMHYAGLSDDKAGIDHPDWVICKANGEKRKGTISTFCPYTDQLLIPQFKELSRDYQVDGVWVDGECYQAMEDYSPQVLALFREKTGITDVPQKPGDPHRLEFLEFFREGFRQHLNHFVTEMHQFDPHFQICSNWAYASLMPEPPTINVDYISADYSWENSYNEGRFQARCIRPQGKTWDLMAWGFRRNDEGDRTDIKSSIQLMQEAAAIISQGGGFQVYFMQNRDGSIMPWYADVMAPVAKFCRQRQKYCQGAESIPQIAMLYSRAGLYHKTDEVYMTWGDTKETRGSLQALLDSQHSIDVVMEHHLVGKMNRYPLIVVPEWAYLEEPFEAELLEYIRNGGNLLLVGPESAALFKDSLGVQFTGEASKKRVFLDDHGFLCALYDTNIQPVTVTSPAEAVGELYEKNDYRSSHQPAGSIAPLGKGHIAAIYCDIGLTYRNNPNPAIRDLLDGMARRLFPDPMVEVTGTHCVDVVANRLNGKPLIHLINTAGPHADAKVLVFDEIPPIGPLRVKIKVDQAPKSVHLQPAGIELKYDYNQKDGAIELTVPRVDIHEIIVPD
jgi:hypothetical protein